jgi:hypothetical protein
MHRSIRTGALAATVLLFGLGACSGSGGDSKADVQDKIADQLSGDGGLSAKEADCFAGVIVDEVGVDKLKDVDFSAAEPPPGIREDFAAAAILAIDKCDIDPSTLGQ